MAPVQQQYTPVSSAFSPVQQVQVSPAARPPQPVAPTPSVAKKAPLAFVKVTGEVVQASKQAGAVIGTSTTPAAPRATTPPTTSAPTDLLASNDRAVSESAAANVTPTVATSGQPTHKFDYTATAFKPSVSAANVAAPTVDVVTPTATPPTEVVQAPEQTKPADEPSQAATTDAASTDVVQSSEPVTAEVIEDVEDDVSDDESDDYVESLYPSEYMYEQWSPFNRVCLLKKT
jgi:hypothetical protein